MIIQYEDKKLNKTVIEMSLKCDEEIACDNATVIVDKNGNITGWINNDIPLCIITKED